MRAHIEAVSVNHNTSAYSELMLRSLFAHHNGNLSLSATIFDNDSVDDTAGLRAYAARQGVPIVQSGFGTRTQNNSHGEVLRRFVLERPDCSHYLFLDADVCFIEDNTPDDMLRELDADPTAFGIGARMSWDGLNEMPEELRRTNPDVYDARLHPCCALVRNTDLFRRVVDTIGLSCAKYLWADREEYLDTFKLMTKVMSTHGLRHIRSARMVIHFFCVSYDFDPAEARKHKASQRDALLHQLRGRSPQYEDQPKVGARLD